MIALKTACFLISSNQLSEKQELEIKKLQDLCFPGVNQQEVEEDFYHPECAHALTYLDNHLIVWAGIHKTKVKFLDKRINLGGFGVCVHPDYRKAGVGFELSQKVMKYLKNQGCDIAFLSIDTLNEASRNLHKKTDFVFLFKNFSWIGKSGQLKQDDGGMIAPLNSIQLFNFVLNKKEIFHVGNGYW